MKFAPFKTLLCLSMALPPAAHASACWDRAETALDAIQAATRGFRADEAPPSEPRPYPQALSSYEAFKRIVSRHWNASCDKSTSPYLSQLDPGIGATLLRNSEEAVFQGLRGLWHLNPVLTSADYEALRRSSGM